MLRAPARTSAAHALVAAPISHHDTSADVAAGSVAQVDHSGQGVGGVDAACSGVAAFCSGVPSFRSWITAWVGGRVQVACFSGGGGQTLWAQVFEEELLLSGQEPDLEPAEDVVHDRLGIADVGIAGPAAGLEAGVRELLAKRLERNAILQRQRRSEREAVHEAADRGTFFRHLDEKLAGFSVGI